MCPTTKVVRQTYGTTIHSSTSMRETTVVKERRAALEQHPWNPTRGVRVRADSCCTPKPDARNGRARPRIVRVDLSAGVASTRRGCLADSRLMGAPGSERLIRYGGDFAG